MRPQPGCPLPDAVTAVGSGHGSGTCVIPKALRGDLGEWVRDEGPPGAPITQARHALARVMSGHAAATLWGGCNSALLEGIGAAKAEGVCSGV